MIFPKLSRKIGLYPIVDHIKWLELLLPLGIKSIQIRIKPYKPEVKAQIQECCKIASYYHTNLFVNDYWDLAIENGAYGVHLGQEDLKFADIKAIWVNKLRLGISTHTPAELKRALVVNPSYIAYGPIFATTSKAMKVSPRGLSRLSRVVNQLTEKSMPLVAIGGINSHNIKQVVATGVNGIALISGITQSQAPIATAHDMMKMIERFS